MRATSLVNIMDDKGVAQWYRQLITFNRGISKPADSAEGMAF